jgi:hypothetical protein
LGVGPLPKKTKTTPPLARGPPPPPHTHTYTRTPDRRWQHKLYSKAPRKVCAHTAMSDIKESLQELRYYKQVLFRSK